jgi:hypothetical protein
MGSLRGMVAGLIGVAGMAGAIGTVRRAILPPDHEVKTHPEKIIEHAATVLGRADELDVATRRRLGDLMHFGYGAAWGAVYAAATHGRRPHPLIGGLALGSGLWTFGFNVLMPVLGVQKGPWTWGGREFLLTGVAHAAYGTVTTLALEGLDALAARPQRR